MNIKAIDVIIALRRFEEHRSFIVNHERIETIVNEWVKSHYPEWLDESNNEEEERRYTFDEMILYGAMCAVKGKDMNAVMYFKEKLNVDITKPINYQRNDPQ